MLWQSPLRRVRGAHLLLAQKLPSRKNYVFAKVLRRNFIAICIIIHPRLHSTIVGDIGIIPGWIYPYLPIFLLELEILQVPTLTSTSSSFMVYVIFLANVSPNKSMLRGRKTAH